MQNADCRASFRVRNSLFHLGVGCSMLDVGCSNGAEGQNADCRASFRVRNSSFHLGVGCSKLDVGCSIGAEGGLSPFL